MLTPTIILFGKFGKRLNSKSKKQYLKIDGKPILCHTIDKFYHHKKYR